MRSAQSQHLGERFADAKSIATDYSSLKRGPEVVNFNGTLWEFTESKTSFICTRRIY